MESDLTTQDVAQTLRLHRATVQRMLKTGRLKGYQVGRDWRIPPSALNEIRGLETETGASLVLPEKQNEWERLSLNEEYLAEAPAIPLESMRRKNFYEAQEE